MKTKAILLSIALFIIGLPLFAAYDAFLKIDSIPGESTSPGHQGWIDVESFSWGASPAQATREPAASRCSLHSLTITKRLDKASPMLAQSALSGNLLPSVTVEVNGERHMLQNVQVKSVQNVNGVNGPAQAVTLNFTKCATHEMAVGLDPMKKANLAGGIVIKGDSNGMLALGGGLTEPIALQDLHFTGPNQAVLTCRKAGGSNSILIGLLRASANGQHIPEVKVQARKAGGTQQEYMTIKLTDVLVSSYQSGGAGAGFDQITLNFGKLDGPMAPFHDIYIK